MAYDQQLAERIRALVAGEPVVVEKKMFGGLAFLIGDNMAMAASGQGGVLVQVAPSDSTELVGSSPPRLMEMRGRQITRWLRLDPAYVNPDTKLGSGVDHGARFARSLQVKEPPD